MHCGTVSIEKRAVHAVTDLILRAPTLDPSILTGDKTPLTDGDVALYSSSKRTNDTFIDRVPVQVKGRTTAKFPHRVTHRISKVDLIGYQRLRGIVYFLVLFDRELGEHRVHYQVLEPFMVAHLLRSSPPSAKSIAVEMSPLPSDSKAIERVFHVAQRARRHDVALTPNNDSILTASSLRLTSIDDLDFTSPIQLDRSGPAFVLEAVAADGSSTPLDGTFTMFPPSFEEHEYSNEISAGDITYSGGTKRTTSPGVVQVSPGAGITLTFTGLGTEARLRLQLTLPPSLADRLKAVRFFHAAATTGQLTFDKMSAGKAMVDIDSAEDLSALDDLLTHLTDLDEILRLYDVDTSLIDMTTVNEGDFRILNPLEHSRRENPGYRDMSLEAGFLRAKFGSAIILLAKLPDGTQGNARLSSPFNERSRLPLHLTRESNPTEPIAITIYDAIPAEDIRSIVNLRLNAVVEAYESVKHSPELYVCAHHFVANLIAAADSTEARHEEFLTAALDLIEWLIVRDGDRPEYRIDRYQILARTGSFEEVLHEVRALRRDASQSTSIPPWRVQLSCAILLGDYGEIRFLEQELEEGDRKEMQSSTLWSLVDEALLLNG